MIFDRGRFLYAANYCEENVWHLCRAAELASRRPAALFISNAARCCPLWAQRQAAAPGEPVTWDYHVVLLAHGPPEIFDLDSALPFPTDALTYLRATFPHAGRLPPHAEPCFRWVPAETLRDRFASDRSHMRRPDGSWQSPPPPWPAIATSTQTRNLRSFVDMTAAAPGERLDLAALTARIRELEKA